MNFWDIRTHLKLITSVMCQASIVGFITLQDKSVPSQMALHDSGSWHLTHMQLSTLMNYLSRFTTNTVTAPQPKEKYCMLTFQESPLFLKKVFRSNEIRVPHRWTHFASCNCNAVFCIIYCDNTKKIAFQLNEKYVQLSPFYLWYSVRQVATFLFAWGVSCCFPTTTTTLSLDFNSDWPLPLSLSLGSRRRPGGALLVE